MAPEIGLAPILNGLTDRHATLTLLWNKMVFVAGFAPAISPPRTERDTKLRYTKKWSER